MPILSTKPASGDSVLETVSQRDRKPLNLGGGRFRIIVRALASAAAIGIGALALLVDDISIKIETAITGGTPTEATLALRDCLAPPGTPGRNVARCTVALDGDVLSSKIRAEILVARAALHLAAKEPWKAIADYSAALDLRPDWSTAYFGRAQAQLPVKRYEAVLEDLDRAVRLDFLVSPRAHRWRGMAFYYLNRPQAAFDELTHALEFRPEDTEARGFLGLALLNTGAIAKATAEFDRAIVERPNRFAHYGRSQARLLTGDPEGALADANTAIALGGNAAVFHLARCRALGLLDRGGDAAEACDAGLALDPGQPELYAARALARWQTGDHQGARDDLTRVPEAMRAPDFAMQEKLFIRLLVAAYLHRLGYDPGPVDGVDRPKLRAAVEAYQLTLGLPVDGEARETLLTRMRRAAG